MIGKQLVLAPDENEIFNELSSITSVKITETNKVVYKPPHLIQKCRGVFANLSYIYN